MLQAFRPRESLFESLSEHTLGLDERLSLAVGELQGFGDETIWVGAWHMCGM